MLKDAIVAIKRDEGFEPRPYQCPRGFLTIGYGFLIDQRVSEPMPEAVADVWLTMIVNDRWEHLQEVIPWVVDQPEDVQNALVQMSYQLGVRGLLNFKRMLNALENGDRELAAIEAMDSRWARQTSNRAKRVAELIRGRPS